MWNQTSRILPPAMGEGKVQYNYQVVCVNATLFDKRQLYAHRITLHYMALQKYRIHFTFFVLTCWSACLDRFQMHIHIHAYTHTCIYTHTKIHKHTCTCPGIASATLRTDDFMMCTWQQVETESPFATIASTLEESCEECPVCHLGSIFGRVDACITCIEMG